MRRRAAGSRESRRAFRETAKLLLIPVCFEGAGGGGEKPLEAKEEEGRAKSSARSFRLDYHGQPKSVAELERCRGKVSFGKGIRSLLGTITGAQPAGRLGNP